MTWNVWARQVAAITILEVKRFRLARRWVGIYFLALAPVVLMALFSRFAPARLDQPEMLSQGFANFFQLFMLRFAVFMSSAVVFSQLFRGDVLEKTLHFYLLAPVRREVITIAKYLAGVILVGGLFMFSTAASHVLIFSARAGLLAFYLEGPGLGHLIGYLAVILFATIAYGAIFLLIGMFFKNPGIPALFLLGWESASFALPSFLQHLSVVHYLQGLLPLTINRGPFAVLAEQTSPVIGIPLLLVGTAVLLAISGWYVRFTQITYSAD